MSTFLPYFHIFRMLTGVNRRLLGTRSRLDSRTSGQAIRFSMRAGHRLLAPASFCELVFLASAAGGPQADYLASKAMFARRVIIPLRAWCKVWNAINPIPSSASHNRKSLSNNQLFPHQQILKLCSRNDGTASRVTFRLVSRRPRNHCRDSAQVCPQNLHPSCVSLTPIL